MKFRGVEEKRLVESASDLVDVVVEFRRRLHNMRIHIITLWKLAEELEELVQQSSTIDPFTRGALLRICSKRSVGGVVRVIGDNLLIPDGGVDGEPTR